MNNPDTQNTRQIEGGCAKSPKIFWRSILIFGCIGGALIGFTACRMLSPDHVDYAEELRFAVYENDTNRVKVLLEQHPEVVESAYDYNPHGDFIAHTPPEANTNTNRVFRNYLLEQYRPLHIATAEGHLESIRLLLAAHANPNLQDLGGMTPLHAACFHPSDYHPSAACVSLLLEAGANPNLASKGGTPLQMVAIQQSSIDVARLLLDHGADPNFYPSHIPGAGREVSPLYRAIAWKNQEMINLLRQHGARLFGGEDRAGLSSSDLSGLTNLPEVLK